MKIGEAIDELRANRHVKRPDWGQHLLLEWKDGKPVKILRQMDSKDAANAPAPQPIMLSHSDILAEDWMVA